MELVPRCHRTRADNSALFADDWQEAEYRAVLDSDGGNVRAVTGVAMSACG